MRFGSAFADAFADASKLLSLEAFLGFLGLLSELPTTRVRSLWERGVRGDRGRSALNSVAMLSFIAAYGVRSEKSDCSCVNLKSKFCNKFRVRRQCSHTNLVVAVVKHTKIRCVHDQDFCSARLSSHFCLLTLYFLEMTSQGISRCSIPPSGCSIHV